MDEKRLHINPTLFIRESKEWLYLIVDEKVYRVKMDENERKRFHEVIACINKGENIEQNEACRKSLLVLKRIGAIRKDRAEEEEKRAILIRRLEHLEEPDILSHLSGGQIHIDAHNGLYAYMSENELILAKKEIIGGKFLEPCEKQQELIVQTILKNKTEILQAMEEYCYLSMSLTSYIRGVRILKEYVRKENAHDYIWLQPWYTQLEIEDSTYYPLVRVCCMIDGMSFEAIGTDTGEALYYIYDEYRGIRAERERMKAEYE